MNKVDRISNFVKYFENELRLIEEIGVSTSSNKFKKSLYVSAIDALAKCVFPTRNSNRDRFVTFVKRFANWKEGYKISMPHLAQLLRLTPEPAYEKLRKDIFELYDNSVVHRSQINGLDTDPTYEEIKKKWPVQKENRIPIEGVTLEHLQHFNLLYAYRNILLHELREPGYGIQLDEDEEYPYYHGMTSIDGDSEIRTIELVYPVKFFRNIAASCLKNLETYLIENSLDTYDYYKFGSYWITELNDSTV